MSRAEVRAQLPPSKCAKVLYYTWKLCSVVFSHCVMISLVVAYCILGAVTFERLEAGYEREVKMNISLLRANATDSIWRMTNGSLVLRRSNWTRDAATMLRDFENSILFEMKVRGWDGHEATGQIQWTFTGALFYSIIVITTIGYGHIAPKTQAGKVVTIFYAIVGIPLMLLCLSNIGDVMAESFRFLYWRVCCYVCTRPPKRRHRRHHSVRRSVRGSRRRRAPAPALPLPPAHGPGTGTSHGLDPAPLQRAHSDTDCRYRDSGYGGSARPRAPRSPRSPRARPPPAHRYDADLEDRLPPAPREPHAPDSYDDDDIDFPKISLPLRDLAAALKDLESHQANMSKPEMRSKSLPRPSRVSERRRERPRDTERDDERQREREQYEEDAFEMHDLHDVDRENYRERKLREMEERDRQRRRRGCEWDGDDDDDYEPARRRRWDWPDDKRYRCRSEYYERDHNYDWAPAGREGFGGRERRARSALYDGERRWDEAGRDVAGTGRDLAGRRRRLRRLHTLEDPGRPSRDSPRASPDRDEWSDDVEAAVVRSGRPPAWGPRDAKLYPLQAELPPREELKPVPIWLCVCLVASYIVAGTFLFKRWEQWTYLDAAYFCFITLTTIGFGDFVPAQGQRAGNPADAVHSIALCSLYLLFGIALLAMSFNLVQEEVRANVAALATKLGIIKSKDEDVSDSEY